MRLPSGTTDQFLYFYAVDASDFTTPETGLTATSPTFRVYRSRNGAAAALMTTPTINETDATNMPGVYELLLDEDTTIDSGNDSEEMVLHISHPNMAPVVRTIELYRPKITLGETIGVTSGAVDTVTTNTDMRGTDSALLAANFNPPTNWADLAITATTGLVSVGTNSDKSGYSISGTITTLDGLNNFDPATDVVANVTLVDTCTTNTDMRGTDGANTTAPDNASIAAILVDTGTTLPATLTTIEGKVDTVDGVADAILVDTGTTLPAQISGLNNLSSADVNAACDTALADYDAPTKAEMDTGFAAVPTATENADALLNRDMSAVSVTNSRSPINALRFLRNKWSVSGTTLTVTAEDDSTSAWSATLTTDAAAEPITGSDPS